MKCRPVPNGHIGDMPVKETYLCIGHVVVEHTGRDNSRDEPSVAVSL